MKPLIQSIVSIAILAAAVFGWQYFSRQNAESEDNAKGKAAPKSVSLERAQQTRVMPLKPIDYTVEIESQGIIATPIVTQLTPQVSGRVIEISPSFDNGAFFKKGDILLELDPTDYESAIISAEANLARAESALAQEQARADQALRNWQDIGFTDPPNDLVLRKPQLKEAQANLSAQKAALDNAKRNLERTKIHAPFDGRVRSRSVGLGQAVGNGTKLGEIFSTEYAELRLPLSTRQLKFIDLKNINHTPVVLTDAINPSPDKQWNATILRTEGELDPTSRELFLIARINDPFNLKQSSHSGSLRINQPVSAKIKGNTLKNVVEIPRSAVSGENEIILVVDGKVKRLTLDIAWSTIDTVIALNAELHGATLALSKLSYTPEGAPLRIITDPPQS